MSSSLPSSASRLFVDPRARMHAVRDRADRHVVDRAIGPEAVPHLARDLAVQRRDAVRVGRGAQRERREPEGGLVGHHAAESDELVPGEARTASTSGATLRSTSAASKTSFPAGTGVCVVNTVDARSRCSPASRARPPSSTSSRSRSSCRNAEWPSFRWKTVGSSPRPRSTRTPPTPSTSSCRRRCSRSPP